MRVDRIAGAICIALACAMLLGSLSFYVPYQYEPLGPKVFPVIVSLLLGGAGAAILLRPGREAPSLDGRHAVVLAALVGYAFFYERLGFMVATTLVGAVLATCLGARPSRALAGSLAGSVVAYVLLAFGLDLNLPLGRLWSGWRLG